MSISEALLPIQRRSSDSESPSESSAASPSAAQPRRISPQETQPGETSPTMQSANPSMSYAPLAGLPNNAAGSPTYFLMAAPLSCGLPPGSMVYIPMAMQMAPAALQSVPMMSPRSQLHPSVQLQLQQSMQALRAELSIALDQSSGPEGGVPAARVDMAPLLIEDPNSVQTVPSWGPASEMKRRRVWRHLLALSATIWIFAIIGIAAPAVLQSGNATMGYWTRCSGGSCSSYSIEQDWVVVAQAFATTSVVSATAMLVLVCLAYQTITRAAIVHAVGAATVVNFLSVLIAISALVGEMATSMSVSGLNYGGGLQVTVLFLDLVLLALCCIHAEPAVTPVRRWDYYTKLVSFPSCAVLSLEPVLCSILAAALPSIFEATKVVSGVAVLLNVGFFQTCATSAQSPKHCSYWDGNMPAGVQAAEALAIVDVLFCLATFCCMLIASRWDNPKAPLLVAISALASIVIKVLSLETLLVATIHKNEAVLVEFSKMDFGSDSQIAAGGVHLLLATICILFAAKRQSFVRD